MNGTVSSIDAHGESVNGESSVGQVSTEDTKVKVMRGTKAPTLPHITNNIVPLSNILKYHTQEAFKQLVTVIENLSATRDLTSDLNRKKKFLQLIISLRQEFVKIYVLVKWASNAKDIGKLIDVLNWLRSQEYYFDQLCLGLSDLNRYSGAKLPNPDLPTSLEVLVMKRPQLPSYNLIERSPVSPEKILEVLQELNLVLTTRMALMDDLPNVFVHNYTVKNGRVYLQVDHEFQVQISVANDLMIELKKDYYKSPFFFVDFRFSFGINPETLLITHGDEYGSTRLPEGSFKKLEAAANSVLLHHGFHGLYDLLHKYSISFKIYLMAKQLKEICVNSKWRGNLQFKYQKNRSLLIINYWSNHYMSKNWQSFIELGMDRNCNIGVRWFKHGKYDFSIDFSSLFREYNRFDSITHEDVSEEEVEMNSDTVNMAEMKRELQDLSIDLILSTVVNKHSEILMQRVYEELNGFFSTRSNVCYLLTPQQLFFKLTPNKSSIFAINPLTGFFYFIDPSPIQDQAMRKINLLNPSVRNQNSIKLDEMGQKIVEDLVQVRLDTFNEELSTKLGVCGWIKNRTIVLNDYETMKLFNFFTHRRSKASKKNKISFFRCKNWPSGWFLTTFIEGTSYRPLLWVTRIKSVKGEWTIQWIQKVNVGDQRINDFNSQLELSTRETDEETETDLNYIFFENLSILCSNMIIDHMILEELQTRHIQYMRGLTHDRMLKLIEKFELQNLGFNEETYGNSNIWRYESMMVLYNDSALLPLENSSTCLFLETKLISDNYMDQMKIKLFGKLRNLLDNLSDSFEGENLTISSLRDYFEINDVVNLSAMGFDESTSKVDKNLLGSLLSKLKKFSRFLRILNLLVENGFAILSISFNAIKIKVYPQSPKTVIIHFNEKDEKFRLEYMHEVAIEDSLILKFLNRYLGSNRVDENDIIGVMIYLQELHKVFASISNIKKQLDSPENKLPNGLKILNFEIQVDDLNYMRIIFFVNYTNSAIKKYASDKISVSLCFKTDKFSKESRLNCRVSMKENLTSKNLKYKSLFGNIFKNLSELEASKDRLFIKFNYDFFVDCDLLPELLMRIRDCFQHYFIQNAAYMLHNKT